MIIEVQRSLWPWGKPTVIVDMADTENLIVRCDKFKRDRNFVLVRREWSTKAEKAMAKRLKELFDGKQICQKNFNTKK